MLVKINAEKEYEKVLLLKAIKRDKCEIQLVIYKPELIKTYSEMRAQGHVILDVEGEDMTFKNKVVFGITNIRVPRRKSDLTQPGSVNEEQKTELAEKTDVETAKPELKVEMPEVKEAIPEPIVAKIELPKEIIPEIPEPIMSVDEPEDSESYPEEMVEKIELAVETVPETHETLLAVDEPEDTESYPEDVVEESVEMEAPEKKEIMIQEIKYVPVRNFPMEKQSLYFEGYMSLDDYIESLDVKLQHDKEYF